MIEHDSRLVGQRGYFYSPSRLPPARPSPPWKVWEALVVVALFAVSHPVVSLAASWMMSRGLSPGLSVQQMEHELFKIVLPLVIVVSHGVGWGC